MPLPLSQQTNILTNKKLCAEKRAGLLDAALGSFTASPTTAAPILLPGTSGESTVYVYDKTCLLGNIIFENESFKLYDGICWKLLTLNNN